MPVNFAVNANPTARPSAIILMIDGRFTTR